MITRRLVRTRQLKEGMKIDQSVVDRAGRNLVQKGSILDNYVIESLLRMGIMMVYIQTGEESDDDIEKVYRHRPESRLNVFVLMTAPRLSFPIVLKRVLLREYNIYMPMLDQTSWQIPLTI